MVDKNSLNSDNILFPDQQTSSKNMSFKTRTRIAENLCEKTYSDFLWEHIEDLKNLGVRIEKGENGQINNIRIAKLRYPQNFKIGGKYANVILFKVYQELREKNEIEEIEKRLMKIKKPGDIDSNIGKLILKAYFAQKGIKVIFNKINGKLIDIYQKYKGEKEENNIQKENNCRKKRTKKISRKLIIMYQEYKSQNIRKKKKS